MRWTLDKELGWIHIHNFQKLFAFICNLDTYFIYVISIKRIVRFLQDNVVNTPVWKLVKMKRYVPLFNLMQLYLHDNTFPNIFIVNKSTELFCLLSHLNTRITPFCNI